MRALSCFLILAAVVANAAAATLPAEKLFHPGAVRVLILSGRNNHDWRTTTPQLRKILEQTGSFDVRVDEEPAGLTADALAPYDVVVLDYDGPRWGPVAESALTSYVTSGKGLVAVHGASYSFSGLEVLGDNHVPTGIFEPAWKDYIAMIGGTWSNDPPKTTHAKRHIFEVKVIDRDHAAMKSVGPTFSVSDELYHNMRMQPGVHVLATAFDDPSIGGTGKDEPVLWTVNYGRGRVFHTTLGHDVLAMSEPGFVDSFRHGAYWAARGEAFTLATQAMSAPVRVMLVTGGHDHEPSLYAAFDGRPDMKVIVNPHPVAFTNDLRKSYDVIVLYDMVQDLDEQQKKNLRDFVESGKGVVVLHHAVADFSTTWPWWYDEVTGARYILKAEPEHPASTYLHDQALTVKLAAEHPVLRGIPPFHIEDETYKHMWFSPKIQVLLTTDHPTSDGPVAWIGPYQKSRVVCIQLGHGSAAHRSPAFRNLVHNAILWSAGK